MDSGEALVLSLPEDVRHRRIFDPLYAAKRSRETGELTAVVDERLFGNSYASPQPRLFAPDEAGWFKVPRLQGYAT